MSSVITPKHISDLMGTDRVVVRYYNGNKRLAKVEFTPKTLDEYLQHFVDIANIKLTAPQPPLKEEV